MEIISTVLQFISQPWAWYVAGPLIALVMFLLLKIGGNFGVSASLQTLCSMGGAGKYISFFSFDWKKDIWNIFFVAGSVIGGFLASTYLVSSSPYYIDEKTIMALSNLGISFDHELVPNSIFSFANLSNPTSYLVLIMGGLLVGFGARWAGGCTSGHAISGMSNLQLPSLLAVIGFFVGGLLMTHILFPLIFG